MKKRLALLILLSLASPVLAQRNAEADHTCYLRGGHADQRECLDDQAKHSEQKLESQEAKTRSAILRANQGKDDIDRAVEVFDRAVSEYRHYRTEQCDFVAALAFGGNAQGDRRLLCEIDLDAARIRYLKTSSKDAI